MDVRCSRRGPRPGAHDAGVEAFKGDLERYLAREAIQNSLDARLNHKQPVHVQFQLLSLKHDSVPGLDVLSDTCKRCSQFWDHDKDAKEIFDHAQKLVKGESIKVLKIGDSNTTGVDGGDEDKLLGWYNLTRCIGASAKAAGAGGSFGLGKHAPFAASGVRTIFYSTLTTSYKRNFLGVAKLATHQRDSKKRKHVGWFGGDDGASITTKTNIPKDFRREEPGTDLYVLGYEAEANWKKQIVRSVLENFWPAIHRGDLTVTVEDVHVTKKTRQSLLTQYSVEDKEFEAHLYYKTYLDSASVETVRKLPILGEVTVRLLIGDANSPNHVAMIRATGMVIYLRKSRSRIPYCGTFECRNEDGNQILRTMEPPQHDNWDADRPEKKQESESQERT